MDKFNENIRVLIVEDDSHVNNILANLIKHNGYEVTQAYSGTEGILHLKNQKYKLVVLDMMIPGMNGKEVLTFIRESMDIPVIVISAKIDKADKIEMLNIGADDYITKPFDIEEVSARINTNLRRYLVSNCKEAAKSELRFKNISMDIEAKEVFVEDERIALTAREFSILELMMKNPNKVFSKSNIFESVWENDYLGDENTVNVHMSNLRSKLHKARNCEEYIQTIWGMGYKLK